MKKFLAVLTVLFFVTGAVAQKATKDDTKKEDTKKVEDTTKKDDTKKVEDTTKKEVVAEDETAFTFGLDSFLVGFMGAQNDFAYDAAHIRLRPSFTIGKGDVKGIVKLEIDQDFGKEATDAGADAGTDNKEVEVKWANLKFANFFLEGLGITAGLDGYKFPFVVDNDFALASINYSVDLDGITVKPVIAYIKINEYDGATKNAAGDEDKDDLNTYALDIPVKIALGDKDFVQIRPGFMYFTSGDNNPTTVATLDKTAAYNVALNVTGALEELFSFEVTGAYLGGKYGEDAAEMKLGGYAADAVITVNPIEIAKISVFATMYSGDDNATDDKTSNYVKPMKDILGYGATFGRLFLINAMDAAYQFGGQGTSPLYDQTANALGLMIYGFNAEVKPIEGNSLTIFAQFGYVTLAKENTAGDKGLGMEIDLKVSYDIIPKTCIFVEAAYFLGGDVVVGPDSDEDEGQNGYEIALGCKSVL